MAVIAQASFGVPSRKSILQKQEKYVLLFLNSLINNMRVRRQSYLLFCLFPILFVVMTILLNIKIKFSKKDSSTSSTGKLVRRTFINQMEYLGMVTKSVSSKHHDNCQNVVF